MNSIVTLPDIAAQTARIAGVDNDTATRFIVEVFARVEAALTADSGSVDIKGIGCFHRDASASGGIRFTPDKALAEAINAPFALFSPVELPENTPSEIFTDTQTSQATGDENEETPEEKSIETEKPSDETTATEELGTEMEEEAETGTKTQPENEPEQKTGPEEPATDGILPESDTDAPLPNPDVMPAAETEIIYVARHSKWPWVAALIALAAGFAAGYILGSRHTPKPQMLAENVLTIVPDTASVANTDSTASAMPDTARITEPEAQDQANAQTKEPVYDTVSPTRFLTTIARDHYGRKDFWVFIYEANANHLRHPNRIRPGTKVLIPDLGPHAALDSALRARAHILASEIYRRYDM